MQVGKISEVVKTPWGFHIFRVEERREARNLSLRDSESEIAEKLKAAKFRPQYGEWIAGVRSSSKIEIDLKALSDLAY
jgi:parvulin-like peptidyl-prolyl isomerase